jgi:hypothetical protein
MPGQRKTRRGGRRRALATAARSDPAQAIRSSSRRGGGFSVSCSCTSSPGAREVAEQRPVSGQRKVAVARVVPADPAEKGGEMPVLLLARGVLVALPGPGATVGQTLLDAWIQQDEARPKGQGRGDQGRVAAFDHPVLVRTAEFDDVGLCRRRIAGNRERAGLPGHRVQVKAGYPERGARPARQRGLSRAAVAEEGQSHGTSGARPQAGLRRRPQRRAGHDRRSVRPTDPRSARKRWLPNGGLRQGWASVFTSPPLAVAVPGENGHARRPSRGGGQ